MVVLTKKIIESHDIVLDTNILHCKDKSYVANSDFEEFWQKHSAELDLCLKIPYVVFGELLFQQTTSALKTLTRANDSIDRLSKVTNKSYSHQITENRVRKEVKARIETWLKANKAEILYVPVNEIDWARVIEDSIWRRPPFSYDPKNDDLEKGFRDSVILETLCEYTNAGESRPVIFVSNDNLLREAAEKRLKGNKRIKIMTSLDDVGSYLKLMREDFTESFVDSIIDKASLKFINRKDTNSIVFKENLKGVLKDLAGTLISNPGEVHRVGTKDFDPDEEWRPLNKGKFTRPGKSQFLSIEDGHTFYWKEDVRFSRDFELESWDNDIQTATLMINFDVRWKANVSEKGRFTKVTYIKSELINSEVNYQNG